MVAGVVDDARHSDDTLGVGCPYSTGRHSCFQGYPVLRIFSREKDRLIVEEWVVCPVGELERLDAGVVGVLFLL